MIRLKSTKEYFLNVFQNTLTADKIEKIYSDKLEMLLDTPENIKTEAQRRTYYQLLGILDKSGCASYSYDELKRNHKKESGMFHYEKLDMSPAMEKSQRYLYSHLTDLSLKKELGEIINQGKGCYDSISDATIDQMTAMIRSVLNDIDNCGVSSKRLDRIRECISG